MRRIPSTGYLVTVTRRADDEVLRDSARGIQRPVVIIIINTPFVYFYAFLLPFLFFGTRIIIVYVLKKKKKHVYFAYV